MTASTPAPGVSSPDINTERRVLAGTLVGTAIEWYDYFIYASVAALVFGKIYFEPLGTANAGLAQLLALASIGISFLFRPLGAVIAGHLGDRVGRKRMLVLTLLLMGGATALIGLLPTYSQIGVWAPILLITLRIVQGFSAGGEWGGAALMAVEHAPRDRRGLFGAYPQLGVPIGMLAASLMLTALTATLSPAQFTSWGWRIPFLISVALIGVGYLIRRTVDESPVFEELRQRRSQSSAPLKDLFTRHTKPVVQCALIFIGSSAAGYLLIAFLTSYATRTVGLDRTQVLAMTSIAAAVWIATTLLGGALSDRIGRRRAFQIGYLALIVWIVPMFLLIDTANIWLYGLAVVLLTVGIGISYGPMSAMYAEMFPAEVRYSGVSIGYALGAVLGGAFAALIAQALIDATGWSPSVGLYIIALSLVSIIAVTTATEVGGTDLRTRTPEEGSDLDESVPVN
ncbi:MFS transporter [Rhodococcus sp. NPDC019627]|uniref:MFS transporter n=1 Tax=unclassified Rhodococcus (in: high G+C Gram-positive bacteria) TaxID=192944 RepID=UPI0034099531